MRNGGTVVDEAKEKEYQAVIDELMAENKMLSETVTALSDKLDIYETAMINAFIKWGQSDEH